MKRQPTTTTIGDPASWVRYKASLCTGCFAGCCTLPVSVSTEDLFHMGYLAADEVNGPLEDAAERLASAGVIQSYAPKQRIFVLSQHKNGDCRFLTANRRCRIYDRRPAVCREFPLNSRRPGFCPNQKIKA